MPLGPESNSYLIQDKIWLEETLSFWCVICISGSVVKLLMIYVDEERDAVWLFSRGKGSVGDGRNTVK